MDTPEILCSIALYESNLEQLGRCLESLARQEECPLGARLEVMLIENSPHVLESLPLASRAGVIRVTNAANLGFCGAHNQAAHRFLASDAVYWLILNPDLRLESDALAAMCRAMDHRRKIGSVCAKLYRADTSLDPVLPRTIDAAGMIVTPDLRHLDRGSGEPDGPEFDRPCYVFGGTGACLLLSRPYVESLLLEGATRDGDKALVAAQLAGRRARFEPQAIPAICFTDPEVVSVGALPQEAGDRREIAVAQRAFGGNGRALTMAASGEVDGFLRLVVRRADRRILGIQAVGPHVSELSGEFVALIEMGAVVEDLQEMVHAHPTMGELLHEVAQSLA